MSFVSDPHRDRKMETETKKGIFLTECSSIFSGMSLAELAESMTREAQNQAPLLEMLSELLQEQIRVSDRCRPVSQEQSSFEGSCCHLSVAFYVQRIVRYSGASPCCLVATLLYLERFRQRRPAVRLTSSTLQRLLLVAAMTATKYLEDVSCSNTRWAVIGGLTLRETNALEIEFLTAMDFNLSVHPDDYARCATELRTFHAARRSNEGRSKAATQLPSVSTKETDTCAISHSGKYDAGEAYFASNHAPGAKLGKLRFSPAPRGPATPGASSI